VKKNPTVKTPFFVNITTKQKWLIYICLLILLILSGFLDFLPTADNQIEIVKSFKADPVGVAISTIIFAPFNEELLLRSALQKLFFPVLDSKVKTVLYVLVSSFVFGYLHVLAINLQIIPYMAMGMVFSLAYVLLKNVKYDISLHIINNLMAVIALLV